MVCTYRALIVIYGALSSKTSPNNVSWKYGLPKIKLPLRMYTVMDEGIHFYIKVALYKLSLGMLLDRCSK